MQWARQHERGGPIEHATIHINHLGAATINLQYYLLGNRLLITPDLTLATETGSWPATKDRFGQRYSVCVQRNQGYLSKQRYHSRFRRAICHRPANGKDMLMCQELKMSLAKRGKGVM